MQSTKLFKFSMKYTVIYDDSKIYDEYIGQKLHALHLTSAILQSYILYNWNHNTLFAGGQRGWHTIMAYHFKLIVFLDDIH